jgi:hypothetical protein
VGRVEAKPFVRLCLVEPGQRSGTAARGVLELLSNLLERARDLERLTRGEQQCGCLVPRDHGGARRG